VTGRRAGRFGGRGIVIAAAVVTALVLVTAFARPARLPVIGGVAPAAVVRGPLQPLIDATPAGASLRLDPGIWSGPAVITRPMVLRGRPGAIVDGGGVGTVLSVKADGVTVAGLTIRNSGDRHDIGDAGLRTAGSNGVIENLVIEDCLYAVWLQQANGNVVRSNRLTSKDLPEERRGDAVRVWYSTGNLFEANEIRRVRDGFGVRAEGNRVIGNTVLDGRYGVLLLDADRSEVRANRLLGNAVGVMAISSDDVEIVANLVGSGRDIAGQGVLIKESSRVHVRDNELFANAQAIYLDGSPTVEDEENLFSGNRIAFSGVGVTFHSDLVGNVFEANRFVGNHGEVVVRGGGAARRNRWTGNLWDSYEGFDRDGDGVGDTPFEVWAWADRLWMDVPAAQLFRGAPSIAILDFTERLTLGREPRLVLSDPRPKMPGRDGDPVAPR
jgi:nitrous oxidase accessory protein